MFFSKGRAGTRGSDAALPLLSYLTMMELLWSACRRTAPAAPPTAAPPTAAPDGGPPRAAPYY